MRHRDHIVKLERLRPWFGPCVDGHNAGLVEYFCMDATGSALSQSGYILAHAFDGHQKRSSEGVCSDLDEIGAVTSTTYAASRDTVQKHVRVLMTPRKALAHGCMPAIDDYEQSDVRMGNSKARNIVRHVYDTGTNTLALKESNQITCGCRSKAETASLL